MRLDGELRILRPIPRRECRVRSKEEGSTYDVPLPLELASPALEIQPFAALAPELHFGGQYAREAYSEVRTLQKLID